MKHYVQMSAAYVLNADTLCVSDAGENMECFSHFTASI